MSALPFLRILLIKEKIREIFTPPQGYLLSITGNRTKIQFSSYGEIKSANIKRKTGIHLFFFFNIYIYIELLFIHSTAQGLHKEP
jgi:hypothetical protein